MRSALAAGLVAVGSILTGCSSISTFGLARTLDQGKVQFAAAAGVAGDTFTYGPGHSGAAFAQLEGALRYGVTDHAELGLKAWLLSPGIALDAKFALLRSNGQNGFNLSVDPGIGYSLPLTSGSYLENGNTATFSLPVLLGCDFGGNELVLGPRLVDQFFFSHLSGRDPGIYLYAGASLGIAWKPSPNAGFRLMPEISVLYPLGASVPTSPSLNPLAIIYQAGVAVIVGGYDSPHRTRPVEDESRVQQP